VTDVCAWLAHVGEIHQFSRSSGWTRPSPSYWTRSRAGRPVLPEDSDVRCIQSATATYDEEGFSAAAVTAIDFNATGMLQQHLRTVRQVSLTFDRPNRIAIDLRMPG
jgi:hypothetical protein